MTITFEKSELEKFIADLEKWHRDRFDYVLFSVIQNYEPHHHLMRGDGSSQIRDLIRKFDDVFKKDHPYSDWRQML